MCVWRHRCLQESSSQDENIENSAMIQVLPAASPKTLADLESATLHHFHAVACPACRRAHAAPRQALPHLMQLGAFQSTAVEGSRAIYYIDIEISKLFRIRMRSRKSRNQEFASTGARWRKVGQILGRPVFSPAFNLECYLQCFVACPTF